MKVTPLKAVLAGLVAAISFAIPVVDDGLVASEVLGIILAGLTGLGVVYRAPRYRREKGERAGE